MNKHLLLALLAVLLPASALADARPNICGQLTSSYGPYDYRKGTTDYVQQLHLVEVAHFTPDVEAGIKGNTTTLGGDLNYTLTVFPNHARALATMSRVALKLKTAQLVGAKYPVECYFERGIRFTSDDPSVRAGYGSYLYARGQFDLALVMFEQAYQLDPENATINYNLALALMKHKQYEKANLHAQRAYALGFPLPGLRNMLVEAKKWDDTIDTGIKPKAAAGEEETKAETPADAAAVPAPATPAATDKK